MSVQAIGWALSVKAGSTAAKCVLIALANYADANGICWPSQALIAKQTEQSIDTVQRRLKDLETQNLVSKIERKEQRGKQGGLYFYQLSMPKAEQIQSVETTPQPAARLPRKTNHAAGETKPHRTAAASNEPSGTIKSKKDNSLNSERRGKPKHGQKTKDGKRFWLNQGTSDFELYWLDFKACNQGTEPQLKHYFDGSGSWFNILGESKAA